MKKFKGKILSDNVEKLTLKEIDNFIEEYWLTWTCKFKLSPCGHLTLTGKKEYIKNNIETINELIKFEDEDALNVKRAGE